MGFRVGQWNEVSSKVLYTTTRSIRNKLVGLFLRFGEGVRHGTLNRTIFTKMLETSTSSTGRL